MAASKKNLAADIAFLQSSVDPAREDYDDCRALWSAVIRQAVADCRLLVRGTSVIGGQDEAERSARWLMNAGHDMREVLLYADIDQSAAKVLSELGKRALDGDRDFVERFYDRMKNTT